MNKSFMFSQHSNRARTVFENFSFFNPFLFFQNSPLSSLMIWPVCFVSLAGFVQIHLFASDLGYSADLHFPLNLTWKNAADQSELMVQSRRNSLGIHPCPSHEKSLLIARCFLIETDLADGFYRCQSTLSHPHSSDSRLKREAEPDSKRPSSRFFILLVAILCFVAAIAIVIIVLALNIMRKRQTHPTTSTQQKPSAIADHKYVFQQL